MKKKTKNKQEYSPIKEFKRGDKVIYLGTSYMSAEEGATGIVTKGNHNEYHIHNACVYIDILWDRNLKWHEQSDGGYDPEDFGLLCIKLIMESDIYQVSLE